MDHLEFRLLSHTTTPAGESAAFALQVPPDLLYLQGHFPGYPLLPGIAQLLAIALDRTHNLWPSLGQPQRVTQLKFKRPIFPGDPLELQLGRTTNEVRFSIVRTTTQPELCTHGTLIFRPS
ncbi:hypothetical protein [Nannocystis sp.]|uniref:ApeI family dehydratase n=1 Tax=Nannocystis sp. TaxID=1962667 RepID=UPI0025CEC9CF|nr:hypothetical protein [Nannocystis sp.]MBK7827316.1 hypothetical protein [Nannocystis sp.]